MEPSISAFDPRSHPGDTSTFSTYRQLRSDTPVYQLAEDEFVVLDYETATQVLRDAETFPVIRLGIDPEESDPEIRSILAKGWPVPLGLIELEGSEHTIQRALVSRAFTPRRVKALEEPVQRIVDDLCDDIDSDGEVEFRSQFSMPMSSTVIAFILGVDNGMLSTFKEWVESFILQTSERVFTRDAKLKWAKAVVDFQHYMVGEFARRRANPQDDLLSDLLGAYDESGRAERLDELLRQALGLLVAGTETTANALTLGMWQLIHHPDQLARIREDRSLLLPLVEEVLRYETPLRLRANRIAACDTELRGVHVPAGSRVVVVLASANRDELKFSYPEHFTPERTERPHLAFGMGSHFCLGAALARLELKYAFGTLLDRFDRIELGPSQDPTASYIEHAVFHSLETLHLSLAHDPNP